MNPKAPTFQSNAVQTWFDRGSIRSINGNDIFVIDQESDKKSTIILIHGFPTSTFDFETIWQALGEHHRLVCLDMLGFGFSDKPNKRDYTIHKQADLFDSLIKQLKIDDTTSLPMITVLAWHKNYLPDKLMATGKANGFHVAFWMEACFPRLIKPY